MGRGALIVGLMLLTAGLAGCVGGSDDGSDTSTASTDEASSNQPATNATNNTTEAAEEAGPDLNVTVVNGTIEGGRTPTGGHYCPPSSPCDNDFNLQVTNATTAVLLELAWNASTEMYMDLDVPFEHCEDVDPLGVLVQCPNPGTETGSSPLVLEVTDSEMLENTGTWDGDLWVESTTPTTVEYTLYITIAEDGELPSDYSNVQG